MRTTRQTRGASAEAQAVAYLESRGWRVIERNVRIGQDEIDVVAVDPGPPAVAVLVEVRSGQSSAFGAPEERVDRAKVAHLYRAMAAVAAGGRLHPEVRRLPRRVDLVLIDRRSATTRIRHIRSPEPP